MAMYFDIASYNDDDDILEMISTTFSTSWNYVSSICEKIKNLFFV